MNFTGQVAQVLDSEHRASLDLLGRVERALGRRDAAGLAALATPLLRQLEHESGRHFAFEEERLFPLLHEAGDGGIAELLTEEHDSLREVADELAPLARALTAGTAVESERAAFQRLALEWIERMVAHIQKETMGLLPLLDDLLDETSDRELAFHYAAS